MNDIKMIKELVQHRLYGTLPKDFTEQNVDLDAALRDQLRALAPTMRAFKNNSGLIFQLIEETLDEILPIKVDSAIAMFAEFQQVPQGSRPKFIMKTGMQRAKQYVTRATNSGVYETFRLDRKEFDIMPLTIGGAGVIDFERYLDGLEDITYIYEVLLTGFMDEIYKMIQLALINSWYAVPRPANNLVYANTFDAEEMQKLCNTVRAYGSPIIFCSPEFAMTMSDCIQYNSNPSTKERVYAESELNEMRQYGMILSFRGVPIVVLPQSFTDETNTNRVLNPRMAYVMPSGQNKIVRVFREGTTQIREWDNRDNSMEVQGYIKVGVAIVSEPHNWGMYYNEELDDGGWDYSKIVTP